MPRNSRSILVLGALFALCFGFGVSVLVEAFSAKASAPAIGGGFREADSKAALAGQDLAQGGPAVGDGQERRELLRAPAHPEGGVVLFDSSANVRLPGLEFVCTNITDDTAVAELRRTDDHGCCRLAPGKWRLDASMAGFGPSGIELRIANAIESVWLQPMVEVVVRVSTRDEVAIPGVRITVCRGDDLLDLPEVTGADGTTAAGRILIDATCRLLATHSEYEPTWVAVARNTASDEVLVVDVHMSRPQDPWRLLVLDPRGVPMSGVSIAAHDASGLIPSVPLGETGADGRLSLVGTWMFEGFHWVFGGTAYSYRHAPPSWDDVDAGAREVRVAAPRKCSGRIEIGGRHAGPLQWRFVDPATSSTGGGAMFRTLEDSGVVRRLTTYLPASWPIRIECVSQGVMLFEQTVNVTEDGWVVSASLDAPVAQRRIYLRSPVTSFQQVMCGERLVFPDHSGRSPGASTQLVQFDAGCGPVTIRAAFVDGTEYLIVGAPGSQDVALTLTPPPFVSATFRLQDAAGVSIPDVVLRVAREGSTLEATTTPGWSTMIGGNVHLLRVGPDGLARALLPPGRYQLEVQQLAARDSLGSTWQPMSVAAVDIPQSGPARFEVTASRPRHIRVVLKSTPERHVPGFWMLAVGPCSAVFGGGSCEVWLSEQDADVRVLDLQGRELGATHLLAGKQVAEVWIR